MTRATHAILLVIAFTCGCDRDDTREASGPQAADPPATAQEAGETESAAARREAEAVAALEGILSPADAPPLEPTNLEAETLEAFAAELGCQADAAAPISERHAELLGMLDEYISRFDYITGDPRPGFIEHFYPHETAAADAFEHLLRSTYGHGATFERRVDEHGHTHFEGQDVADAINAMYVRLPEAGASINACKARGWSDAAARAYLHGMRSRFDSSGFIKMANAAHKTAFAAALARKLGLSIEAYYRTETIPSGFYLKVSGL